MSDSTTQHERLGGYLLLAPLGEGGEGAVWKARCVAQDRPGVSSGEIVALKRLKMLPGGSEVRTYEAQVELLKGLRHPHVLAYRDAFVVRACNHRGDDAYCIVTELLEGQTLEQRLSTAPEGLSWSEAQPILLQIADALAYMHGLGSGVVHRDLKTSNVFITTNGSIKIIDFGLGTRKVRAAEETVTSGGLKGSFDYLAPEFALDGERFLGDERSDVFSFGVCAHKVLTGHLPFPTLARLGQAGYIERWTALEMPRASLRHGALRMFEYGPEFLEGCLEPGAPRRFASFTEVRTALDRIQCRHLQVGSRKYQFEQFLGQGGFGQVYRVRPADGGESVAVKLLFDGLDPKRFVAEASLLERLRHPRLVRYHGFSDSAEALAPGSMAMVLELLPGMPGASLKHRIRAAGGGLPVPEMIELFCGYLDCLDYLHREGIYHRDLKPANLYAPAGEPGMGKLFDLGISKDERGTRTHGIVPTTPDYMPPEFVEANHHRGSRQSDLFSLAVSLYEAVVGRLPFPALPRDETDALKELVSRARLAEAHFNSLPDFDPPVLDRWPALKTVLRRGLQQRPSQRHGSAGEMRNELMRAGRSDESTGAIPRPSDAPSTPRARLRGTPTPGSTPRRRPLRGFIWATAIVLGCGLGVLPMTHPRWTDAARNLAIGILQGRFPGVRATVTRPPEWWDRDLARYLPAAARGTTTNLIPSSIETNQVARGILHWWRSTNWFSFPDGFSYRENFANAVLAPLRNEPEWNSNLANALAHEAARRHGISNGLVRLGSRLASPELAGNWTRVWPDGSRRLLNHEFTASLESALALGEPSAAEGWMIVVSNGLASAYERLAGLRPLPDPLDEASAVSLSNRVAESGLDGVVKWREEQARTWAVVRSKWEDFLNRWPDLRGEAGTFPRLLTELETLRMDVDEAAALQLSEESGKDAATLSSRIEGLQVRAARLESLAREAARRRVSVRVSITNDIARIVSAQSAVFVPILEGLRTRIAETDDPSGFEDLLRLVDRVEAALGELATLEERGEFGDIVSARGWPEDHVPFLGATKEHARAVISWRQELTGMLASNRLDLAERAVPPGAAVDRFPGLPSWHREQIRAARADAAPVPPALVQPNSAESNRQPVSIEAGPGPGRRFAFYRPANNQADSRAIEKLWEGLAEEFIRISENEAKGLLRVEYEGIDERIRPPAHAIESYGNREDWPNLAPFRDYNLNRATEGLPGWIADKYGWFLRVELEEVSEPMPSLYAVASLVRSGSAQGTVFQISEEIPPSTPSFRGRQGTSNTGMRDGPPVRTLLPKDSGASRDVDRIAAAKRLAGKLWTQWTGHRQRLEKTATAP